MNYPIVRRRRYQDLPPAVRRARAIINAGRFIYRARNRANQMKGIVQQTRQIVNNIRKRRNSASTSGYTKGRRLNPTNNRNNRRLTVIGRASGTTHTTSRLIVKRTPREQRFLRKLFKNRPIKNTFVNRFGFAWMGENDTALTTWYSICHLKFNNLVKYLQSRIYDFGQDPDYNIANASKNNLIGNGPDAFIYIGKCTFQYELYNPTNYIITCYVYDLICKRDTPDEISYNNSEVDTNAAPENCMYLGSRQILQNSSTSGQPPVFVVADPTAERTGTKWNSIGMKPTDYHYFNTFWKVKGMKKIILPPGSSHHHVVVFNPKKKITNANLFYPHSDWVTGAGVGKNGVAGLTQATLFGFQGQVAVENDQSNDNTNSVSTLPGKIVVNCVKKVNIWNMDLSIRRVVSETSLLTTMSNPRIMTDLSEQPATAV